MGGYTGYIRLGPGFRRWGLIWGSLAAWGLSGFRILGSPEIRVPFSCEGGQLDTKWWEFLGLRDS